MPDFSTMISSRSRPYVLWTVLFALLMVDISLRWSNNSTCPHNDAQASTQTGLVYLKPDDPEMSRVNKIDLSGKTKALSNDSDCHVNVPCVYSDEVDLRVIIMTFNRASALSHVLASLENLDTMGDKVAMEIWIDRSKKGEVHAETLAVANDFRWSKGQVRVHVQEAHAGIYGQWIDTWRPRDQSRELALLVEDDLLISPHTWQWLKAAHGHYGSRADIQGYSLQSEGVKSAIGGKSINVGDKDTAFLYRVAGSWGFAPHPIVWREFQDWFHVKRLEPDFHPYVDKIVMTSWYKSFEKKGTADSMWTMWFIYYTDKHNLYCVYNNVNRIKGSSAYGLSVHRAEPGLHFKGKPRQDAEKFMMVKWSPSFIDFPDNTKKIDYSGKAVN